MKASSYLAVCGQIVDAMIVGAPKQRNTDEKKKAIKTAKRAQTDGDACWTVKYAKAKPREGGVPRVDLANPAFGYKNHVSIDRCHGLIRRWMATDATAYDSARLADMLGGANTASDVWADTVYR